MVGQRVRDLLPQLTVLNNRQLALGKERRELRKRHFEEKRSTKKEVTAKKPGKDTQAASIQNKGSGKSAKKDEKIPEVKVSADRSEGTPKIPSQEMAVEEKVSVQEEPEEPEGHEDHEDHEEPEGHEEPEESMDSTDSSDSIDPTEFVKTTEPVDLTQSGVLSVETSKETHQSTIEDVRSFLMKGKNKELELDGWD